MNKLKLKEKPDSVPEGCTLYINMKRCVYCWDITDSSEKRCSNCNHLFYRIATEEEQQKSIKKINELREKKEG